MDELDIILTESALTRINSLISRKEDKLRIYVSGGGCSGFEYGFMIEEDQDESDFHIIKDGVVVLVDPISYQYLVGSTIEFKSDLMGSKFVVSNPNAIATCGCGSSFTTKI